jgi:hypothetical protein
MQIVSQGTMGGNFSPSHQYNAAYQHRKQNSAYVEKKAGWMGGGGGRVVLTELCSF